MTSATGDRHNLPEEYLDRMRELLYLEMLSKTMGALIDIQDAVVKSDLGADEDVHAELVK